MNYEDIEEVTTLREAIEQEKHNLDLFNLEVAKFRLKYGMSTELIHLYGAMGRLCKKLIALEAEVQGIEGLWGNIIGSFEIIKDKERRNEGEDISRRRD